VKLAIWGSTAAEHSTNDPEVKGSNPNRDHLAVKENSRDKRFFVKL
jgi:hypothetical protein